MKKSEILKKALEEYDLNMKDHLGYVCHAVQHAVNGKDWRGAWKPVELRELLNEIEIAICHETTVTAWLHTYHNGWYMDNIFTDKADKVILSEYRKAWMQQMIDMYESKGE